jgi:hypothetical protein
MSKVIRTNDKLWDSIIEEIKKENPNKRWNARFSQQTVKRYKDRGGEYLNRKAKKNSLSKWTKEDWQYVDENKKGRYLPKKIIDSLNPKQKKETNENKIMGGGLNTKVKWEP